MNPEDIEHRDFFVGLRGYDREEVDSFLAEVAAQHRTLLDEVETYRTRDLTPAADPIAEVGESITAILRTANEQAEAVANQARQQAEDVRREAEEHATHLRQEAEAHASHLRKEAEEHATHLRQEASQYAEHLRQDVEEEANRLRAEATRILREAEASVDQIEADAERRGRERAIERADAEVTRFAEAARRHENLRARLAEASDELSLALMAMGEPVEDARALLHGTVLRGDVDVAEQPVATHEH